MATKIGTLQNTEKTEALLPRNCLKAVADKNGDYISEDVLASDINALKDGKIASFMRNISTTADLDWTGRVYSSTASAGTISNLSKYIALKCVLNWQGNDTTYFNVLTASLDMNYYAVFYNSKAVQVKILANGSVTLYSSQIDATMNLQIFGIY